MIRRAVTSRLRAVLALLLAIVYLFTNTGVLPSSQWLGQFTSAKLTSLSGQRYPCEDHACGCSSAHECWANCCCYTHHQRIVWALRNGVAPPADAIVTDEDLIAAADDADPAALHCSACVPAIQSKLSRGQPLSASQPSETAACDSESSPRIPAGPARAWSPLTCKSLSSLIAGGIGLGLPTHIESLLPSTPVAFLAPPPDARHPVNRPLDVIPPPPRHIA